MQKLVTLDKQIKQIVQESNKLNNNLKEIYELSVEKVKLMTKVHTASITASGLPHLSVQEMALIKSIADNKVNEKKYIQQIDDMKKTASILEIKLKWDKLMKIFYIWMVGYFILNIYFNSKTHIKTFITNFVGNCD